jgi:small subunit ribosomal protein S17
MAQEETNERNEQAEGAETDAPEASTPAEAESEAAQGSTPAEPESEPAEATPAEPKSETAGAAAPEAAAPGKPDEQLSPKERRRRERSRHSGEALPPRDAAERARERADERRRKAQVRRAWRTRQREQRRAGEKGPALTEPVAAGSRAMPRVRQGVVVSDGADKTITVRIDVTRRHRAYKKIVRESSTLHAHDERNDAGVGDTVRVVESRPLSRTKRWRLVDVLERAR